MSKTKNAPPPKSLPAGKKAPAPVEALDPEIAGLMTEIEDDMREEELQKLWARYGNTFMALMVVVILGVIGWQFWRQGVEAERQQLARQYEQAVILLSEGKLDEALTTYAGVAGKRGQGFAVLAQLQKAAILSTKDDTEGVLAAYQALSEDSSADPLFRDLAKVLYAMHGFDTLDAAKLEATLQPIAVRGNAFYHSAAELTALLAHKRGDTARAISVTEQLLADPETPGGVRSRAEELLVMFKTASAAPAAK